MPGAETKDRRLQKLLNNIAEKKNVYAEKKDWNEFEKLESMEIEFFLSVFKLLPLPILVQRLKIESLKTLTFYRDRPRMEQ